MKKAQSIKLLYHKYLDTSGGPPAHGQRDHGRGGEEYEGAGLQLIERQEGIEQLLESISEPGDDFAPRQLGRLTEAIRQKMFVQVRNASRTEILRACLEICIKLASHHLTAVAEILGRHLLRDASNPGTIPSKLFRSIRRRSTIWTIVVPCATFTLDSLLLATIRSS